jgi:predicted ATPase
VLIVGEPGIGKSRLIEEFHGRLRDTPHTWTEWSCSQLLQNTPLHPIAEWGRQRFGGADVPAIQTGFGCARFVRGRSLQHGPSRRLGAMPTSVTASDWSRT